MVELTAVGEAIAKFAEMLVEKLKRGEKLSSEDYLFLTLYYMMEMIDKKVDKSNEDMKGYVDKRIEDLKSYVNKGFEDMKAYVDKGFESTNTGFNYTNKRIDDLRADVDKRLDDLKSEIRAMNEKIDKILDILAKK